MKIHKEGYPIVFTALVLAALASVAAYLYLSLWAWLPIAVASLLLFCFCVRFFRVPKRHLPSNCNNTIFSPADGTIVAIEEVFEDEYLEDRRIQVSIFMSVWNVHINWYPISGIIEYFKHHHGSFLVAWHPKSSTENERTTTVLNTGDHKVLFRQIAGYVARRIVSYSKGHIGYTAYQNAQCGFIKFGSRVDLFLPLDSRIIVALGDKVVGTQTPIAELSKQEQK